LSRLNPDFFPKIRVEPQLEFVKIKVEQNSSKRAAQLKKMWKKKVFFGDFPWAPGGESLSLKRSTKKSGKSGDPNIWSLISSESGGIHE